MRHAWYGDTETTAALDAWIQTATEHCCVELYDLVLTGLGYPTKVIARWTDFAHDVIFPSPDTTATTLVTYSGGYHITDAGDPEPSPKLVRGTRKDVIGVEVDTLDLDIYPDGTEFLPAADGGGSTPRFTLADAIRTGMFDGAQLTMRRLHLPAPPIYPITPTSISPRQLTASGSEAALLTYLQGGGTLGPGDTSLGAVTLFAGMVTQASASRSKLSLTVNSGLEKLSIGMPQRIFQAQCPFSIYDALCGASKLGSFGGNSFQQTAFISAAHASTVRTLQVVATYPSETACTQPNGYWVPGTIQFIAGPMAGLTRSVLVSTNGTGVTVLDILVPLPTIPVGGTAVLLQAGCNKLAHDLSNPTLDDCTNKFGNFVDSSTPITISIKPATTTVPAHPVKPGTPGSTPTDFPLNGIRYGGFPRVPPPDSAT
jgi:hypothetical protein